MANRTKRTNRIDEATAMIMECIATAEYGEETACGGTYCETPNVEPFSPEWFERIEDMVWGVLKEFSDLERANERETLGIIHEKCIAEKIYYQNRLASEQFEDYFDVLEEEDYE